MERILKNKCIIPIIDELLEELEGAQQFSKLHMLFGGYHQIWVHDDDIQKDNFWWCPP